jgi:NADPH-dependent 2,4-dienoyl-CoA reductase/sulfur reductase-like enzyme/peroxiredoxin family protein/rhodanese-related sulfurtransferase/TusA-related sulfurtransferase
MKYIIIGGGSATAAAHIRRNDETAEIILLEKSEYIPYANCGLPYYIGNVIKDQNELRLQSSDSFFNRFKIDVRTQNEVVGIYPEKKEITIKNEKGETYTESYDKLLISTQAKSIIPVIEGVNLEGVFLLQTIQDANEIKNYIQTKNVKNAVILGADFAGLEIAENLQNLGIQVSIIDKCKQTNHVLDLPMANILYEHLLEKGIDLYLDNEVQEIFKEQHSLKITLNNEKSVITDMIVLATNKIPDTKLAEQTGIKLGETGGILVDAYLQTSFENIYAVGNAVEFPHPLTKKPCLNFTPNPSNRQATIAADNMVFGNAIHYEGAIGTTIAKVFDRVGAATGLNASKLNQLNIPFESIYIHEYSHAECYPDAKPLSVKITFDKKNGKLYGGQVVGVECVDTRIDQITVIIKKGGTIADLMQLEQAYSPEFSTIKDPICIAGYAANNVITGKMPAFYWLDIDKFNKNNVNIFDVRTKDEFDLGAIENAKNISLDDLRNRMHEIPKDKPLYVYCATGRRGYFAQQILLKNGFKEVYNLTGGIKTYHYATQPLIQQGEKNNPQQKLIEENSPAYGQKVVYNTAMSPAKIMKKINASGLQCPGPILKLKSAIDQLGEGETVEITATDPAFRKDVEAWTNTTGNSLLSNTIENGNYIAIVQKGGNRLANKIETSDSSDKGKTIILFSDSLDKAIATFVLANGAAATGKKVTLFFTFWGLNVIKKVDKPKVKKDFFGKMFSIMLPSNSLKLKLSKFNMFGIGAKMMRHIMKKKGIESLETLRQQAIDQGVEFIACEMSMNAMGIDPEELLDNVTVGGVATYMGWADKANVNLFI